LTNENLAANPSAFFNSEIYLKQYSDVAKERTSPLLHYELFGKKEGRFAGVSNPSLKFIDVEIKRNIDPVPERICLFACYLKDGRIPDETLYLLEEVRKVTNAIIVIGDCGIDPNELRKIEHLFCYAKFERHLEYDFGSYKRAFKYADDQGLLTQAKEILICNDSIIGPCGDIGNFFSSRQNDGNPDFYGITVNNFGFRDIKSHGNSLYSPHIQSYFLTITSEIFKSQYWRDFIFSVKKEEHKVDIIRNYEMGMSALLQANGHAPKGMYKSNLGINPAARESIDVLNKSLFLKKSMMTNLSPEKLGNINGIFKAKDFPFQIRGKEIFAIDKLQDSQCSILQERLRIINSEINGDYLTLLAASNIDHGTDAQILISTKDTLSAYNHDPVEALRFQSLSQHYAAQNLYLFAFKFPLAEISSGANISFNNANQALNISYLNGGIPCYNFMNHRQLGLFPRIEKNILVLQTREQSVASIMLSENYTTEDKSLYATILNSKVTPKYKLFAERASLACDNAYELFKHSLKRDSNCYYITSKEVIDRENDPFIKKHLVQANSNKHKELFLNAKSLFCSFGFMGIAFTGLKDIHFNALSYNLYLIWHGISAGDKNSAEISAINTHSCHAVMASSPHEVENFKKLGHKNVVLTGYPRMDKWHNDEKLDKLTLVLFFTWRKSLLNATLEAFLKSQYVNCITELVEKITTKRPELEIYYFIHNAIPTQHSECLAAILRSKNPKIRFVSNSDTPTFNRLFSAAQYLITDYSSVAYDFSYHKKRSPIFYTPQRFTDGHYVTTPLFDKIRTGTHVATPAAAISALKPTEYKRHISSASRFFPMMDGGNCERTFDACVADSAIFTPHGKNI
jgi:hypothetical protein